jgi:hypothetical protein
LERKLKKALATGKGRVLARMGRAGAKSAQLKEDWASLEEREIL